MTLKRVILGSAKAQGGVVTVQAALPGTNDTDDLEPFGELEVISTLGITAVPFPKDDRGWCEGVVAEGIGNNGVCIASRDTRDSAMMGEQLEAGDTVLHSTGPNQAAQCQCKEDGRAFLSTKDTDGQGILVMLDGKNKKLQILARKARIEINEDGDIELMHGDGSTGILIQAGVICLVGSVIVGGTTPDPVNKFVVSAVVPPAPAVVPTAPAPIAVSAAKGIFPAL